MTFTAQLRPEQAIAVGAMLGHDDGILVAPPSEGKTVMACAIIAERATSTLVLLDRKTLAEREPIILQGGRRRGTRPRRLGHGTGGADAVRVGSAHWGFATFVVSSSLGSLAWQDAASSGPRPTRQVSVRLKRDTHLVYWRGRRTRVPAASEGR